MQGVLDFAIRLPLPCRGQLLQSGHFASATLGGRVRQNCRSSCHTPKGEGPQRFRHDSGDPRRLVTGTAAIDLREGLIAPISEHDAYAIEHRNKDETDHQQQNREKARAVIIAADEETDGINECEDVERHQYCLEGVFWMSLSSFCKP